jgi:hypothetical protein
MTASGKRNVDHPSRVAPEEFSLDVLSPDYEEYWIDGLQIYHNPRATNPLGTRVFSDGTHHFWRGRRLEGVYVDHAPFAVTTAINFETVREGIVDCTKWARTDPSEGPQKSPNFCHEN